MNKEILLISHHQEVELGIMEIFFKKNNFNINVIKPFDKNIFPSNINNFNGIIILGGAMNAEDTEQFPALEDEIKWLNKIINLSVPILGICLGAQLIAKSCGAKVKNHKDNIVEVGYKDILSPIVSDQKNILPKKVYHWHKQGCSLPVNAKLLAYNSTFEVQSFSIRNKIFGFQFHPEVNESMILNWNEKSKEMLAMTGAENREIQLEDHLKYSNSVKIWFEKFLKDWLDLN